MFAYDPRLIPSSHRFRLTVFGLLCLSASFYCVLKTFYLMIDHNLLTLTSANDSMRLQLTQNNYIIKEPISIEQRNIIEILDNTTESSEKNSNSIINNEKQGRRILRTKRDSSSHWSPLPHNLAPNIAIDNKQTGRAISHKDNNSNHTPLLETLSNGFSSITSVVGAKINNHQQTRSAIKKSTNNNHVHRIARNENLRTSKEQVDMIRPHGMNAPSLKTVISDNNYNNNRLIGQSLLKQESSRRDSIESSPMSSLSRPAIKRKFTIVTNSNVSHHHHSSWHNTMKIKQPVRQQNNAKENRQGKDAIIVSSSNYSYSRSNVPLLANNYDNNQWKPIPDDYNGPLLPVQVDIVDGIYEPSATIDGGGKYSPQRGRYNTNTVGQPINGLKGGKHLYSEKPLDIQPTQTHKIYKRVLLCDKTLVSLDFAQNLKSEPRLYGMDSNLIDLEALNIINNDENINHIRSSNSFKYPQNHSQNNNNNEMKAINRNHINSVLSESDPLVACDMWDLEKGLSSRKPPRETLRQAVRIDFHTIRDTINKCRALSEKTLPPVELDHQSMELSPDDVASIFSVKRGLMPGTKWCGLGDSASSYNDLGTKKKIDICCRAHDHCPIRLKPFRQGYGILNLAIYTKSHCDCDEDFYRCLKSTRTKVADLLGNIYFNVLKLQCMQTEKLKICKSIKKVALGFEKCVKWEESPDKKVFRFIPAPVAY